MKNKRRAIVIVDFISLQRLACGEYFNLLLKWDVPILVSDMAFHEAEDDLKVMEFCRQHADVLGEIKTNVPAIAGKLRAGNVIYNEVIRLIVYHCELDYGMPNAPHRVRSRLPVVFAGAALAEPETGDEDTQYALIMDGRFFLTGVSGQCFIFSCHMLMPLIGEQAPAACITKTIDIMRGRPVVNGTRVPADNVMAEVNAGTSMFDIFASYPSLPLDGVDACIKWNKDSHERNK